MARPKFPKIIVLNVAGAHGNFLRYSLDRFAKHTPSITDSPFNSLGNSHVKINYSDYFEFEYWDNDLEYNPRNKNIIAIDIAGEALYYERACIHRAADSQTNLFSEDEIAKFLRQNGSTFPDFCKNKNMTLKDGFMHGFKNADQQGSIVMNKEALDNLDRQNSNIFRYQLSNFLSLEKYRSSIGKIGEHFGIEFDLADCAKLYEKFYDRNIILQTHNKVNEYLDGNTAIELDILQQAYVDAQTI